MLGCLCSGWTLWSFLPLIFIKCLWLSRRVLRTGIHVVLYHSVLFIYKYQNPLHSTQIHYLSKAGGWGVVNKNTHVSEKLTGRFDFWMSLVFTNHLRPRHMNEWLTRWRMWGSTSILNNSKVHDLFTPFCISSLSPLFCIQLCDRQAKHTKTKLQCTVSGL